MSTRSFHLAQLNVARAQAPLDDPSMADFVAQLDAVNALAERSPGFVWRLQGDSGQSSSYLQFFSDPALLVNLTVWESVESLYAYTYRSDHVAVFRQRKQWFEPHGGVYLVLWWVPAGHIPTMEEANERLEHLREHGAMAFAFTFRQQFPPPE